MATEVKIPENIFDSELQKLEALQAETEEAINKYKRILKEFNEVQENVEKKTLEQNKQITTMRKISRRASVSQEKKSAAAKVIAQSQAESQSYKSLFPSKGNFPIRLLIGNCNVRMLKPADRQEYKLDYNRMCRSHSFLFILINALFFFFPITFLDTLWCVYNVYFYVTITLREHILLSNGSHIRTWWIIHHYICMFLFFLIALTPKSDSLASFRHYVYLLGVYEGVVNYYQSTYQRNRVYALTSLNKIDDMEVVNHDSAPIHYNLSITRILPLLILGYILQFAQGTYTIYLYIQLRNSTLWTLPLIGLILISLAIGNFSTAIIKFCKSEGGKKIDYIPEWSPQFFYGSNVPSAEETPSPTNGDQPLPSASPTTESVRRFDKVTKKAKKAG